MQCCVALLAGFRSRPRRMHVYPQLGAHITAPTTRQHGV